MWRVQLKRLHLGMSGPYSSPGRSLQPPGELWPFSAEAEELHHTGRGSSEEWGGSVVVVQVSQSLQLTVLRTRQHVELITTLEMGKPILFWQVEPYPGML